MANHLGRPVHGHSPAVGRSRTYRIWASMVQRCTNQNSTSFHRYGGRGITVDDRWKVFANFLHDMGEAPAGCSIDRIDNERGYYQGNCRWSTAKEQANNTRTNRFVLWDGEQVTVSRLAEIVGIPRARIYARLNAGWSIEEAVRPPLLRGRAVSRQGVDRG